MKWWISLIILLYPHTGYGQCATDEIDLSRIPQKKVRTLIESEFAPNNVETFNQLSATYHQGQNLHGYHIIESIYFLKQSPEEVWKAYQLASPAESWNGRMISFGLLISKWNNTVMYRNDRNFTGIDTGQVFFVNLKILKGLYNLAVGLEIINVDSIEKSITFSYVKGGKSRGEQTLYFLPTRKGCTEIVHQTAFKSNSYIRDRYLYPFFHRKAINEFHKNMKRRINNSCREKYNNKLNLAADQKR